MRTKVELPKVSIRSNNVGYSPKMEGYATLMSDINELCEMPESAIHMSEGRSNDIDRENVEVSVCCGK